MTYKGHIENGQIVLDEGVILPDGATVVVALVHRFQTEALHPEIQQFTGIIPAEIDARSEYLAALQAKHT